MAPEPASCVEAAVLSIQRAAEVFGEDRLCLSFNGGKDCTVLLHLIREALP